MKTKNLVAIDLGGESCRVSLLACSRGRPVVQEIHRFSNRPLAKGTHLVWDIGMISEGVYEGLHRCATAATEPIAAIGIDGWACDYVRLRPDGDAKYDPYCYRDERTIQSEKQVHHLIERERLYQLTGTQRLRFNTLYQLYADCTEHSDRHLPWLNIPEFLLYRLGGRRVAEFTNATHTSLVSLPNRNWCAEVFDQLGIDLSAAPEITPTGSVLGGVAPSLTRLGPLRRTRLIAPACHDTASAIAGIPATGDDWAFISSGTWSLVGTLLDAPCTTAHALAGNFSNLGAAGDKICFLKNVNGMWLLNQCLTKWKSCGYNFHLDELFEACSTRPAPGHLLNVDDPDFLVVGDMPELINSRQREAGAAAFRGDTEGIVGMANLIVHSLAARYAEVLHELQTVSGKRMRRLYIVGGASKNKLLNRLTAERTGLDIVVGAAESSTIGNFVVQLAALDGDYSPTIGVSYESVTRWAERLSSSHCSKLL